MKKIIAALALMLAVGISAQAQERKATSKQKVTAEMQEAYKQAALKDIKALKEAVSITPEQEDRLLNAFVKKHEILSIEGLSQERKESITYNINKQLMGYLGDENYNKISQNSALLNQLTH